MESNEWVKQVLKDLIQDLGRARSRISLLRARSRISLLRGEKVGARAAMALSRINTHFMAEHEAAAREALAAVEEDS